MTAIWAAARPGWPRLDEIERRLAGADAAARRAGHPRAERGESLRDRLPELRRQVTNDPLWVRARGVADLTDLAERVCAEVDESVPPGWRGRRQSWIASPRRSTASA